MEMIGISRFYALGIGRGLATTGEVILVKRYEFKIGVSMPSVSGGA
jgi:hypothetical protein